jgi:hypothetical protein
MSIDYWLDRGPHATPDRGRCAMEWVSYLAGEPHNDQPACVSPAVRSFCVALNDGLDTGARQRLRPYLTRTIGTAGDGLDDARAWMAMDWLVRVYTPAWLDLARLGDPTRRLASRGPVQEVGDLFTALEMLKFAGDEARAALMKALRRSPIGWVLPVAAERTARQAAWASGEAAVWTVVRIAIAGDAGKSGCVAARVTAGDAAAAAARAARANSRHIGSKDAARDAIAPTVDALKRSSLALLDRMLPTEPIAPAPDLEASLPVSRTADGCAAAAAAR